MEKAKIILCYILIALSYSGIAQSDGVSCLQETFESLIGVREATGNNDGPEVEMILASVGLPEGYAWCAALINYAHQCCGLPTPEKAAWSPSWFPKDRLVSKEEASTDDVFGIYFRKKKRIAHVGSIHKWEKGKKYCITIEGNTNDAGSREGDGVYRKRRLKTQIYKVSRWKS